MFKFVLVLAALIGGCGAYRSYNPPPITDFDARAMRSLNGFQMAISLRFVGANDGAPMLTLKLRNAGTDGVRIDAASLKVTGESASGARPIYLVDPRGELVPLTMDPGVTAVEKIRLADEHRSKGELTTICVDVSRALSAPLAPVCFVPGTDAEWSVRP